MRNLWENSEKFICLKCWFCCFKSLSPENIVEYFSFDLTVTKIDPLWSISSKRASFYSNPNPYKVCSLFPKKQSFIMMFSNICHDSSKWFFRVSLLTFFFICEMSFGARMESSSCVGQITLSFHRNHFSAMLEGGKAKKKRMTKLIELERTF